MEKDAILELARESARLEQTIARMYLEFSRRFSEDREFWLQLYIEEKNHSAIFTAFAIGELPVSLLASEIMAPDLRKLIEDNQFLSGELELMPRKYLTRLDAFRFALEIERLSGESVFQEGIVGESDSEALFLLQRINKDDKDHADRINRAMARVRDAGSRDRDTKT